MKTNKKLIAEFLAAEKEFRKQENRVERYFNKQVKPFIDKATTVNELTDIKEFLRNMPQMAGKVFIFKSILIKQEELNNLAQKE